MGEKTGSLRVVLDTDVFISALRSEKGASYQILRLIGKDFFQIYLSVPLILEYEAVANRGLGHRFGQLG